MLLPLLVLAPVKVEDDPVVRRRRRKPAGEPRGTVPRGPDLELEEEEEEVV